MRTPILILPAVLLAAAPATAKAPAAHVHQTWKLHKSKQTGSTVIDRGTASGAPFGAKKPIVVRTDPWGKGTVLLGFTEQLGGKRGSVNGRVTVHFRFNKKRTRVLYSGKGRFADGTGAYAHAAGKIRLSGYGLPDGRARLKITGSVRK